MYQGGTYLGYGDAASGRGLLAMLFLKMGAALEERCMFVSPGRPQDWHIQAATVHFDLQGAYDRGQVRMLWIPDVSGLQHLDDASAVRAMNDLVALVYEEKPDRLVINDFMPFMQFRSFEGFRQSFVRMLDALEASDTTILLLMPEPINTVSQQIIDFMRNNVSGSLHVSMDDDVASGSGRRLLLLPGIGHVQRASVDDWELATIPLPPGRPSPRRSPRARATAPGKKPRAYTPVPGSAGLPMAAFASQPIDAPARGARFFDALRECFGRREHAAAGSFMLMALRMERNASVPAPVRFDELAEHLEQLLRADDHMLVDDATGRIVLLMPGVRQSHVQGFFDALQESLAATHPAERQHLLESVDVVVVPDGLPFERAEDFMAYAMEAK